MVLKINGKLIGRKWRGTKKNKRKHIHSENSSPYGREKTSETYWHTEKDDVNEGQINVKGTV